MKPAGPVVGPLRDEQAQQDIEAMQAELLHDIQDGDEAEDEQVETVSHQLARIPGNRPGSCVRGTRSQL
jgi:hypothetical protein